MTETTRAPASDRTDDVADLAHTDPDATQELIETYEAESPTRRLGGAWALLVTVIASALSIYALWVTQNPMTTQIYRMSFVGIALVLTFLLYPMIRGDKRTG